MASPYTRAVQPPTGSASTRARCWPACSATTPAASPSCPRPASSRRHRELGGASRHFARASVAERVHRLPRVVRIDQILVSMPALDEAAVQQDLLQVAVARAAQEGIARPGVLLDEAS